VNSVEDLHVVIALFGSDHRLRGDTALHERFATSVETSAAEAVIVAKDASGELTMTRSNHSVGRSLAELTGKLMIALPLGFHGVVALTNAGAKIAAANRDRPRHEEVGTSQLTAITDQIEPGGAALIASVSESQLSVSVAALEQIGATSVWHVPVSDVEEALEAQSDPG